MRQIVNNRPTLVELPPAGEFQGVSLIPGVNHVPDGYVEALDALPAGSLGDLWRAFKVGSKAGPMVPAAQAGPWVTVLDPAAPVRPKGPEIPTSLEGYSVRAAVKLVAIEKDPDVLEIWAESEGRAEVKDSIATRLAQIRPAVEGAAGA